jgi:hypothetical protein
VGHRAGLLVAAMSAVVALAAGCSGSEGYDRIDFVGSLEDNGVPSDQANCIADGVEGRIDLDALENQDEITEQQAATLNAITRQCILGSSDTTVPGADTTTDTQLETEGGNDEG